MPCGTPLPAPSSEFSHTVLVHRCFSTRHRRWINLQTNCRLRSRISDDLAHAAMIGAALLIYSARGINRNYVKSAAGITLKLGDFYTCSYCLQVIKWDHHRTRPTKDHFFPKSKKQLLMGAKTPFVLCCQPCNSRKSDKVFSSIEEVREFIRSRRKALRCNIDGN